MIGSLDKTGETYFIPTALEYQNLIRYASAVDRENHLDLVHDSIISTDNLKDAKRFISGRKYAYLSVREKDLTVDLLTDQVCSKCNGIKPICQFERKRNGGLTYLRSECRDCRKESHRIWGKQRREKARKRENGLFCAVCDELFSDAYICTLKSPKLRRKRVCHRCRNQKDRKRKRQWRSRNTERIREYRALNMERHLESVREWKKRNRDKMNSYNRAYRKRLALKLKMSQVFTNEEGSHIPGI